MSDPTPEFSDEKSHNAAPRHSLSSSSDQVTADPRAESASEKSNGIWAKAEEAYGPGQGPLSSPSPSPSTPAPVDAISESGPGSEPEREGDGTPQPAAAAAAADPERQSAPEASRTRLETTIIMLSLCSALFLAALDITIVTTAVPTIAAEFDSNLGYTWIGSAFILTSGAFVPIWGKISDIWGRKPILLLATGVFWVGSLLCGVSVDMAMLIAARAIQGAGAGGIVTLVNICISDLFSMRNRGFYFGLVGIVWAVASAIGPVLGGVFTMEITWRWCFYINLPICGVAMLLLFFMLKLHNPRTPVRKGLAAVDWLGSATIVAGTVMFLLGLQLGGVTRPWSSPTVLCLLIFGVAVIGAFYVVEWKVARYPILPLQLLRDRSNVACLAVAFFHSFVFISGSYYLPLYFQGVLRLSSLMSGVYLLAFAMSLSACSAAIGFIIRATGNYKVGILTGMAVMTLGVGLFIDLGVDSSLAKIILYQVVAGFGVGPNFQSPLIALQAGVEGRDVASATSAFSFARQMAGTISVVVGGAVFSNQMQQQYPALLAKLGPELAGRLSGEEAAASILMVSELRGEEGDVARAAYARSLQIMYTVYVAFGAAGLLIGFFIRQKTLSRNHTEHKTGLKTLRSREAKTVKA
ncbi:related to DHA14-like major facilitator efflux transporter [Cephalotrichum gorgonifer]|uniref:Efflux pump dotC n=1 Tax=Cephalotrichum gorgonifer TaxID=2041049 RepID=A0AAE8MZI7_9PEZI|nr:related to DHA14-like major facilitator efflux transporter [Cephalotrichum gorgonifer]